MLSSNVAMQGLVTAMANLTDRETAISEQMSSGLRLTALSDDAAAAGQAVSLANALRSESSFTATAASAGNTLQTADAALSSVVTQLTSAITTATGALTDTTSASNRSVAAQEIAGIRDTLFSLANSSYNGSYLFGGTSQQAPFQKDADGTITYTGNSAGTFVTTPDGQSIATSLPGSSLFSSSAADIFSALSNVITALQNGDTADDGQLVNGLHAALTQVTTQRALLNTSQRRLSDESDYVQQQGTALKVQQGTLLSASTAELATELSAVTTQRSALLGTIATVQKGSLFDYL